MPSSWNTARTLALAALLTLAGNSLAQTAPSTVPSTAPQTAPAAPAKIAVPTAAALKEPTALVASVFASEIAAAKTPAAKLQVAKKIQTAAAQEKDPVSQYVLLTKTKELAAAAGDVATACEALSALAAFDIDVPKTSLETLTALSKSITTKSDLYKFLKPVVTAIDAALGADNFEAARCSSALHVTVARQTAHDAVIKQASELALEIRETELSFLAAEKAGETLTAKPDDPDANLKVGKYRCFYKAQWDQGLPALALCSNADYKKAAFDDIKGASTDEEKMKLADQWWTIATPLSLHPRTIIQERAAKYYAEILPNTANLLKTKLEKRIAESNANLAAWALATGRTPISPDETFAGKWNIGITAGTGVLTLNLDHTATPSWRTATGTWEYVDDEIRVHWEDGWTDVFRFNGNTVTKYGYRPGVAITEKTNDVYKAVRQK